MLGVLKWLIGSWTAFKRLAQTFQNPLIKVYTLNYNRDPFYDLRYIP